MVSGLIADMVCPRVRTGYKFTYTTLKEEDLLSIPDVRASRASLLNQVEFGASDTTDSVVDYGLEDPVPYRDIDEAQKQEVPYDPLALATESTAELVKLAREKRVADLLTTAANYATNHSTTLAGNAQWSHANSNPRDAIMAALDVPLVRPNTLVFGQAVWTKLRQHPKIVEAIKLSGAGDQASGVVMKAAVAALFEVDNVYVGQAWYQSAKRGQDDSFARLWGRAATSTRPSAWCARPAISRCSTAATPSNRSDSPSPPWSRPACSTRSTSTARRRDGRAAEGAGARCAGCGGRARQALSRRARERARPGDGRGRRAHRARVPLSRRAQGDRRPCRAAPASPSSDPHQFRDRGTPQREVRREVRLDPRALVVSVVTDDVDTGGPAAQAIARRFGLRDAVA